MRAETAGARTWLLGGLALWALATWLLGLFGLGGRIQRLPPDPALAQALPGALAEAEDRLGPMAQYAEIGERPLFTTDRRPQPFFINPVDEDAPAEFEYVLTSVLLAPEFRAAILQPSAGGDSVRLKVGEAPPDAPGWQLASIAPRSAVFDGPEGQRTLELRVFDGVGGEAPTAMAAPSPTSSSGRAAPEPRASASSGGATGTSSGERGIVVTTSSQPAPTEVQVPAPEAEPETPVEPPAARSNEEQVEAIRARIEARRARLREQAQQGQ